MSGTAEWKVAEERKVTPEELHALVRKVVGLRTVTAEGEDTVAYFIPLELSEKLREAASAKLVTGLFTF